MFLWFFVVPELLPKALGDWIKQMPPPWGSYLPAVMCLAHLHLGARRRAGARRHQLAAARPAHGRHRDRPHRGADLPLRDPAAGLPHHPAAAHLRVHERHQELVGRADHRPARAHRARARDAGVQLPGVRGLHRGHGDLPAHQPDRGARDARAREEGARAGPDRGQRRRRRRGTDVRRLRLRRHPALAGLPLPGGDGLHADADRARDDRRHHLRHAARDDAAVGVQAAVDARRRLREPDALAAAGAGDLLVLLPRALHRRLAHRREQADRGRRAGCRR